VSSLSLVSFIHENLTSDYYKKRVSSCLAHAHWYNNPMTANWHMLNHDELRLALNEARVGLCLSAEEGGMKAAIQYLLCGLPVVSTENRGGRDEFFHPDFANIVAADPKAVADAVSKFVASPPNPTSVRAAAVATIEKHRGNFVQKVNKISLDGGGSGYTHAYLTQSYVLGFLKWQSVEEVLSEITFS
jgi:glycosyltransferase involved in cell wall biosynthesis